MRENSGVEAQRAKIRGPKGREREVGFLGRGQQAPSSPARDMAEFCKLPGSGLEPQPKSYLVHLS